MKLSPVFVQLVSVPREWGGKENAHTSND